MEIVIAGAGAIGLLIGSYLTESGQPVSFFTRRQEQADELRTYGVKRVAKGGRSATFQVDAFADLARAPQKALWILAVKSRELPDLVKQLEDHSLPSYLLFVQNGLRHLDIGRSTSITSVGVASLTHGAAKQDDRTVIHNGFGIMRIASLKGGQESLSQLLPADSPLFPIQIQQDAFQMLLHKAVINCCINPLTALLEVKNGELLKNRSAHKLMETIHGELIAAYLDSEGSVPFSEVEAVCRKTSENRSSMLVDRRNGVPMEIDTIVSAILENHEEQLPVLKVLETLLKAIDEREEEV